MLAAQLGQRLGTVVWGAGDRKIFRADYAMPTPPWTRIGADESCPVILPVDSGDVASLNASAPWRVCTTRDEPSSEAIVGAWHDTAPNAAVIASPSAAEALVAAIGAPALARLHAVVAIGRTTAEALTRHGVPSLVAGHTDFGEVPRTLAAYRAAEARP